MTDRDAEIASTLLSGFVFDGKLKATAGSIVRNATITNSIVQKLPLPREGGDAVSLEYLSGYTTSFFPQVDFSIVGNDWIELPIDLMPMYGSRQITINAKTEYAPCASFRVARNSSSAQAIILTLVQSPSFVDGSECLLELQWKAGSMVQVRKSTDEYDGTYELSVSR